MMGGEYGHLCWKGIESAVADVKASKQQALVGSEVLVVVANSGTPIVGHLLIEGEVTLYVH